MFSAKKLAAFFLIGGIAISGAMAKTLVAYFSASGNTERLAQTIAQVLEADLFEIESAVPYTDADFSWSDSSCRSAVEARDSASRPAIAKTTNLSRYDTVVIAFPILWHDAPKIVYTFIESYDLTGEKIVPVCTSGGSGLGNIAENLSSLAPQAQWLPGTRFSARASEFEVKRFFNEVLK